MRRSVSFYREVDGLFTFREHPCVKRIKTECARLSSGNLQLGLHVIGAPWRHTANRGVFPAPITCACRRENPWAFLEIPLSPSIIHHLKQKPYSSLDSLSVKSDETPCSNPRSKLSGWIAFAPGVSSWNVLTSATLPPCVELDLC
jgi:hypothetical protein